MKALVLLSLVSCVHSVLSMRSITAQHVPNRVPLSGGDLTFLVNVQHDVRELRKFRGGGVYQHSKQRRSGKDCRDKV